MTVVHPGASPLDQRHETSTKKPEKRKIAKFRLFAEANFSPRLSVSQNSLELRFIKIPTLRLLWVPFKLCPIGIKTIWSKLGENGVNASETRFFLL